METENLQDEAAIDKIKKITGSAQICMMCTKLYEQPIKSRPMAIESVDNRGRLWFISCTASNKIDEIEQNDMVQLFFMNTSSSEYLSIYGMANIYTDQITIDEHWNQKASLCFKSKLDPNVSIISVSPSESYYWGNKNGKLVNLAKMTFAKITKKEFQNNKIKGELYF